MNGVKQDFAGETLLPHVKKGEVYRDPTGKLHCHHHVPLASPCRQCDDELDLEIERARGVAMMASVGAYGVAILIGLVLGIYIAFPSLT